MSDEPVLFTTRHCFASDIDGDRHILVDAEDADLTGWSLRTPGKSGSMSDQSFEMHELWGSPGDINFLGNGETRRVWIALDNWGTQSAVAVDSEGAEFTVSPSWG